MASDFNAAVGEIGEYAGRQFDDASDVLNYSPFTSVPRPPGPPVITLTPEQKKEQQTWQQQMSAAFKQLGDAHKQAQQQSGYDQVVALMQTTATTAASVATKIVEIMGALPTVNSQQADIAFQPKQIEQLNALREVLNALAALSPAAVWQPAPDTTSKA